MKDGERTADFLQHGLLQGVSYRGGRFPKLRDLTRSRITLKQEQLRNWRLHGKQPPADLYLLSQTRT